MSNITVTMPYSEYENMKEEIKQLKKERLSSYINYEFPKTPSQEQKPSDVVIIFDQEKAIKDIAAANPEIKTINVHTRTGLLVNPIKVNGGDTDATNN